MGCWGEGLFQSDQDLDTVAALGTEAGLDALEDAARIRAEAASKTSQGLLTKDPTSLGDADDEIYYSLYADLCSDVEAVRKHMDEKNRLKKLIDQYARSISVSPDDETLEDAGYTVTILMACAMTLGCKISARHLSLLDSVYKRVGLMDGGKQLGKALHGPDGYKNDGTPYDFGSKGLLETANDLANANRGSQGQEA